ncbi:hypothetical protein [Photorhabdus sp. RW14-46]|uniref:hypothetical protein n=1 Tax=Photorhabdus sp. RW14-46 TaxID=2100168 RepID=UPI0013F3E374|nr:hypothetical protein [Photorhabdus sp. RW14-46]NHB62373.1 hypothetical protein [Photorhabdus sp. RW14-46]
MDTKVSFRYNTSNLTTSITISNRNGKKTIKLKALEFNHKLSPSGKILVVQLANSQSDDSGKFVKINTENGERIYTISPEWGLADDYAFFGNDENLSIKVKYGSYEIDDTGLLIERKSYYLARVVASDISTISAFPAYFDLHGKNNETYQTALASLEKFIQSCFSMFHGVTWCSSALKTKAEILGWQDKTKDALQCCVDALALNPKATVKRMLNSFSKKLGIDKESVSPSDWVNMLKISVEKERNAAFKKSEEMSKRVVTHVSIPVANTVKNIPYPHTQPHSRKSIVVIIFILVVLGLIWLTI